jgi:hypothetical protein
MQAIFASVVPHATSELGFADRAATQETLSARAKLLRELDVERGLLQRLQGFLTLYIKHVSHHMRQDHRYWVSNATCIAAKMGLHQNMRCHKSIYSLKNLTVYLVGDLYMGCALSLMNCRFFDVGPNA